MKRLFGSGGGIFIHVFKNALLADFENDDIVVICPAVTCSRACVITLH